MTKKLSKAIMNRSRFKNNYLKLLSCENVLVFKLQKNICNFLTKKTKNTRQNKKIRDTVNPFLTFKGYDPSLLANKFNKDYTYFVFKHLGSATRP